MKYNVKSAAEKLGVSPSFLYDALRKRLIRHERHGARIVISAESLEEYRKSREIEVTVLEVRSEPVRLKHITLR